MIVVVYVGGCRCGCFSCGGGGTGGSGLGCSSYDCIFIVVLDIYQCGFL